MRRRVGPGGVGVPPAPKCSLEFHTAGKMPTLLQVAPPSVRHNSQPVRHQLERVFRITTILLYSFAVRRSKFLAKKSRLAGRSANRRMKYGNQSFPNGM
jgi:hypothetical protein